MSVSRGERFSDSTSKRPMGAKEPHQGRGRTFSARAVLPSSVLLSSILGKILLYSQFGRKGFPGLKTV